MSTTTPPFRPGFRSGLLDHRRRTPGRGVAATPDPTLPGGPSLVLDALPTPAPASSPPPAQVLWQLRPPGANLADVTVAEHCLAAAFSPSPARTRWPRRPHPSEVSALELHGKAGRVDFALRGPLSAVERVVGQLLSGYRQLEPEPQPPAEDPLALRPGEAASFAVLHLAEPAALPLNTPTPRGIAQHVDPLMGIIHALAQTPPTLRAVSQLVVTPAAPRWAHRYERLLAEQQDRRRLFQARPSTAGASQELSLILLLGLGLLLLPFWVLHGLLWFLWGLLLLVIVAGGLLGIIWWLRARRQEQRLILHAPTVTDKLARGAVRTCLRLYVIGPATGPARDAFLKQLVALYSGAFAGANRLVAGRAGAIRPAQLGQPLRDQPERDAMRTLDLAFHPPRLWPRVLLWLRGDRACPVLSPAEFAALWHFPQDADDRPYIAAQASQQRLPAPGVFTIAPADLPALPPAQLTNPLTWPDEETRKQLGGCYMGTSTYGGTTQHIRFPWSILDRHIAVLGATGSGKSSFFEQVLRWTALDPQTVVFAFDPHGDLYQRLPGLLAEEQIKAGKVVLLDPTDPFPIGIPSLWEPRMAHNQDRQERLVSNLVNTMERLSGEAWGFRVQSNFYEGLTALLASSAAGAEAEDDRSAADAEAEDGPTAFTHTLLDVWDLFTRKVFRDTVLARLSQSGRDTFLRGVFTYQHETLEAARELQEVSSLLNRIVPLKFTAGGRLLGQRQPKLSLDTLIEQRKWLLVNLGRLGEDTGPMVGSLFLSYLHASLRELGELPFVDRPRVLVVIDELQDFDANALIGLFGAVRKFGGRLLVATNSLAKLYKLSPVMAEELSNNIGTWVIGRAGARDAELALMELQGSVKGSLSVRDIVTLPEKNFFVRALVNEQAQPFFRLTLPPLAETREDLTRQALNFSRDNYGRPKAEVEQEVHEIALRFEGARLSDLLRQQKQREAQEARWARTNGTTKANPKANQPPPPAPEAAETAAAEEVRRAAQFEGKAAPGKQQTAGAGRASASARSKSAHPRGGQRAHTLHTTAFEEGTGHDEEEASA